MIKKIRLCGETWTVKVAPMKGENVNFTGRIFHGKRLILIDPAYFRKDSTIHELFHVPAHIHGVDYSPANANNDTKLFIMTHQQVNDVIREVWSGLEQLFEMRVRK